MVSLIATKGKNLNFNILKNIDYEDKLIYPKNKEIENILISKYKEEYLDLIKNAYFNTVNLRNGTGVISKIYDKDWILSGKTGTAQVRRISSDERLNGVISNHMLPWEHRDHALFVSFVPFDEPLYAISVVIEHGGGGSTIAGPIAKEVAMLLKDRHPLIKKDNLKINNIINNTTNKK
jgi:cell division protein FtsI/penicillin-binding protein 2